MNTKKQKEDTAEMDVEIKYSLLPFEKLMAEKTDKLHGALEEISKNVSKLTKHLLKSSGSDNSENTSAKKVVSAANTQEILNAKSDAITNSQQAEIPASTQLLIEQEADKIKPSMIQTLNTKLQKRAAEYWQMVRNKNTAKSHDTWKNNSPVIIPRKLQMKKRNGEPLTQTQLRERQVIFNFQFRNRINEITG